MALRNDSSVATGVMGKVGENVFSRNQFGYYVREKGPANFPNTPRQQQANASVTYTKNRWQNITDGQRRRWIEAAKSGDWILSNRQGKKYKPSGYQLFMSLNLSLRYFLIDLSEPPERQSFPSVTPQSVTITNTSPTADIVISFGQSSFSTDYRLLFFTTAPKSPGITFCKPSWYRWTGSVNEGDINPTLNIKFFYSTAWGNQPTVSRMFIKFFLVSMISGERIKVGELSNL